MYLTNKKTMFPLRIISANACYSYFTYNHLHIEITKRFLAIHIIRFFHELSLQITYLLFADEIG